MLHNEVTKKVGQLQLAVSRQESTYKDGINEVEAVEEQVRVVSGDAPCPLCTVSKLSPMPYDL